MCSINRCLIQEVFWSFLKRGRGHRTLRFCVFFSFFGVFAVGERDFLVCAALIFCFFLSLRQFCFFSFPSFINFFNVSFGSKKILYYVFLIYRFLMFFINFRMCVTINIVLCFLFVIHGLNFSKPLSGTRSEVWTILFKLHYLSYIKN